MDVPLRSGSSAPGTSASSRPCASPTSGHDVVCMDVDEAKIARLERGEVPIYEPGLEKLVDDNAARLSFTTSYDELLDGLPHPLHRRRHAALAVGRRRPLARAARRRARSPRAAGERLLVMKSTVPVGTGEKVMADLEALGRDGDHLRVQPRVPARGRRHPGLPRAGPHRHRRFRDEDGDAVEALYRGIDTDVVRTSVPTAEMVKYASNAFLATKISFINEIANVCEQVGADVRTVAHGMGLDHRIGPHFLQAGIGYGGSCFPKDVQALKQLAGNTGYHFQLLNAVHRGQRACRSAAWSASSRTGSGSLRGTTRRAARPHLQAQHRRPARGGLDRARRRACIHEGATVTRLRPDARRRRAPAVPRRRRSATSRCEALAGADAAVLVTEWPEFARLDWAAAAAAMRGRSLIDGRNFIDPAVAAAAGLRVRGHRPRRRRCRRPSAG